MMEDPLPQEIVEIPEAVKEMTEFKITEVPPKNVGMMILVLVNSGLPVTTSTPIQSVMNTAGNKAVEIDNPVHTDIPLKNVPSGKSIGNAPKTTNANIDIHSLATKHQSLHLLLWLLLLGIILSNIIILF